MPSVNLAVDIGGTFTDLVGYDARTGRLFTAKSSTTPRDLTNGIFTCLDKSGLAVSDAAGFVHGSTIAINTVIERAGAATALVVTRGTRDVYKIARGNRPEAYDIHFKRPEPLVPRHRTYEIDERMLADGSVLTPFDDDQATAVAGDIAASGVDAVAVCFLHSWNNPAHEERMGAILAKAMPGAFVTLSHRVLREYGEYERMSTSVLNAYIGPRVSSYIEGLERSLGEREFSGRLSIMQSNGGVMSPAVAKLTPVGMLESGPVGGFIAAARVGKRLGHADVIAFDMGGTTAKTNLVTEGEPRMAHGYFIGGYARGQPVMLPVVDTVEVGSGGGSIAWVDDVGSLQVGPASAGAEPGPMCYGKGGAEPTVTDANLLLGRLSARALLGGEMTLDVEVAERGLRDRVGEPLGLTAIEAARAVIQIAVAKMSLAVREVSVERGYDPRDFAMVAFGGAGPLHAVEVARELHIPRVIVPLVPGQFSAAGMLMADVKHDYVRTVYQELERADFTELDRVARELGAEGRRTLQEASVADEDIELRFLLEMRYQGQDFALPIVVARDTLVRGEHDRVRVSFDESHERQFGYRDAERPLEIVNLRVSAIGRRGDRDFLAVEPAKGRPAPVQTRAVCFSDGAPVDCPVYAREALGAGFAIDGPAVIQEYGSTTVLHPRDRLSVADGGELVISVHGRVQGADA